MGKRVLAAFGVVAPMNGLLTDLAHLQPLDDFPGWKKEELLENYPPAGWSTVALPRKSPRVARPQTGVPLQGRSVPGRRRLVPKPAAVRRRAGARHRACTHVAPPAGRKYISGHVTLNPLGLGRLMSDRAALDRYEARLSLYTGCPVHPGSRRTPRREAIPPTITLHPRKRA